MLNDAVPNLMQVRAFVRVTEFGSVSQAAVALYRAQSVVTRSISDLERRLGVPLFERHANGMRLTRQGEGVLPRARRVIAELENAQRLLGGAEEPPVVEPLYLFKARRLQLFVKLCETHRMQTVANLFGVSQPAVSSALKALEEGSGRRLFERTPRGLEPTRIGLDILFPIRRALNELRHFDADVAALDGAVQGLVQVGALPLGRTRILPEAIARLTAVHPGVRVATNESPFDLLATELRAGDVDFIFGALRPAAYASDLLGESLLTEDLVLLARHDHPLLVTPVSPADLIGALWVLPRAGSPARQLLDNCFRAMGLAAPQPVVESGDLAIIRGLLTRSNMLAAVSMHQLEQEIVTGELAILPWPLAGTTRAIGLTYRRASLHAPAARRLMAMIREVAAESRGPVA